MKVQQLFDLTGQVAWVTGAASGLGFAMAEGLAEAGAHVVLADLNADGIQAAADTLRDAGHSAEAMALDVSDLQAVEAASARILATHGRLDAAFANAGVSAGPGPLTGKGHIDDLDAADWERVLRINLTGATFTVKAAARVMRPRGQGRIVVTASTAGFRGDGMVGYAYVAAKSAVVNIVRQASIDLAPDNVLVNGIAPGPFRTAIGGGRMHQKETQDLFASRLPLKRVGHPHEIKGAAVLLASEASSFMTGSVIHVDGGALAW
ncbi:SDR family NAD(P)-dependent oxidoreductase [Hydrogenophaga laconesensis]|uniref:NAD(P)-dependent dehydrogenase (Short-subunit alcohol dehydrogenase family) n=1 Tax=Hydrogenophaga laconesensis TaxID=1805971 RepID=A0ABU1V6Z8_9BURK|nr:SDR family NAD(P)-dependent oxidoreductase [Hydrogenophaga laconesensis]MDR7093231.1 NAD(P)-dependent dehydrogenase (short-subunit alcohol dehydrogenase family) [Hydrogenophaga laconesensis]